MKNVKYLTLEDIEIIIEVAEKEFPEFAEDLREKWNCKDTKKIEAAIYAPK